MNDSRHPDDRTTERLRSLARIWSVALILIALFIVSGYVVDWITGTTDPYATKDYSFSQNLPQLFILLAISGLGIAWRWEKLGGTINLVFSIATLLVLMIHWPLTQDLRFIVPYILILIISFPGILFLICTTRSTQNAAANNQ